MLFPTVSSAPPLLIASCMALTKLFSMGKATEQNKRLCFHPRQYRRNRRGLPTARPPPCLIKAAPAGLWITPLVRRKQHRQIAAQKQKIKIWKRRWKRHFERGVQDCFLSTLNWLYYGENHWLDSGGNWQTSFSLKIFIVLSYLSEPGSAYQHAHLIAGCFLGIFII